MTQQWKYRYPGVFHICSFSRLCVGSIHSLSNHSSHFVPHKIVQKVCIIYLWTLQVACSAHVCWIFSGTVQGWNQWHSWFQNGFCSISYLQDANDGFIHTEMYPTVSWSPPELLMYMVAAANIIKFRAKEPSRASTHQFLQTPPLTHAQKCRIPVPIRIVSELILVSSWRLNANTKKRMKRNTSNNPGQ